MSSSQQNKESTKKTRNYYGITVSIVILLIAVIAFLYWFQLKPENRQQLENITGLNLQPLDDFTNKVKSQADELTTLATEQVGEVIKQTPLGSLLDTKTNTSTTPARVENTPINEMHNTLDTTLTVVNNSTATDGSLNQVDMNSQTAGQSKAQKDNDANIIQAPDNAPTLNLVTEASPQTLAAIAAKKNEKDKIDHALAGNQQSSLTAEELALMPFVTGSLGGIIPSDAGRDDDAIVSLQFIHDLARYMVQNYAPSKSGKGKIETSIISTNIYYGTTLKGLNHTPPIDTARQQVLSYIYTPDMLNALYRLYLPAFLESLHSTASLPLNARPALSKTERTNMYTLYSNYFADISDALYAIARIPNLSELAEKSVKAQKNLLSAKQHFALLQSQYEEARYNKLPNLNQIKAQLTPASQQAEQAMQILTGTRAICIEAIKKYSQTNISEDTLMYLLEWTARREAYSQQSAIAQDATMQASKIMRDLSVRLKAL